MYLLYWHRSYKESVRTHHSHGLWVEHLLRGEGGEVCQVSQNVHHCHYWQRDDDGTRKVSEEANKQQTILVTTPITATDYQWLLRKQVGILSLKQRTH